MPSRSVPSCLRLLLIPLLCLLFPVGCKAQGLETRDLSIERVEGGPVLIRAEIARTPDEQQRGLMYRKSLEDGKGMLFVFDREQILSFWMRNTLIPLSIAYIRSDGSILEIRDMYPLDENSVRSSRSVRYALEAPQGWFDRAGIKPEDRLLLSGF